MSNNRNKVLFAGQNLLEWAWSKWAWLWQTCLSGQNNFLIFRSVYYCSDGQVCPHLPSALVSRPSAPVLIYGSSNHMHTVREDTTKRKIHKIKEKKLYQNKTKTKILP